MELNKNSNARDNSPRPGSAALFIFGLSAALGATISNNLTYLCLLTVIVVFTFLIFDGRFRDIFKTLVYIQWLFAFIFLFHLFSHPGQILFRIWILNATREGLDAGFNYGMKLISFGYIGLLMFKMVNPFELVSPLERLARHLGKAGRPLANFSLAIFLALRFLPEMVEQGKTTSLALKTRGVSSEGNLKNKARFASLLIAPLFVNSFKRAELAGIALETKGYAQRHLHAALPPARINLSSVIAIFISAGVIYLGAHLK